MSSEHDYSAEGDFEFADEPNGQVNFKYELIEHVRPARFLYDRSVKLYQDKQRRAEFYAQVAMKLSNDKQILITARDVEKMWNSLRTNFVRECKRLVLGKEKRKAWQYYEPMLFLADHIEFRTGTNQPASGELTPPEQQIQDQQVYAISNSPPAMKRVKADPSPIDSTDFNEIMQFGVSSSSQQQNSIHPSQPPFPTTANNRTSQILIGDYQSINESQAFAIWVAKSLDEMKPLEKLRVKNAVVGLIHDSQYKELSKQQGGSLSD